MTVVITDARYRMTLAAIRELGKAGSRVAVVARGDEEGEPLGFYSRYCSVKRTLSADSPGLYATQLAAFCDELKDEDGPPVLMPFATGTLAAVVKNLPLFEGTAHLLVPKESALQAANDKAVVGETARRLGIPVPMEYSPEPGQTLEQFLESVPLPCVVKPRCGERLGLKAEQRYRIARERSQLTAAYYEFLRLDGPPLIQEYIEGDAFGVSLVMEEGLLPPAAIFCHRRIRQYPISGGPSSLCVTAWDEELVGHAIHLLRELRYTGVAMVEFKGGRLLEVNPRIWGSYPLTRAAGYDFAGRWCAAARGEGASASLTEPEYKLGVRMQFLFSDLAASLQAQKAGEPLALPKWMGDTLNPWVKDGVFEIGDPMPGFKYLASLLKRRR